MKNPSEQATNQVEVKVGETFQIKSGEKILFGRNPSDSQYASGDFRLLALGPSKGFSEPRELSRAVVEIKLDEDGTQNVISRTTSNDVWLSTLKSTTKIPNGLVVLKKDEPLREDIKEELGADFNILIKTNTHVVQLTFAGSSGTNPADRVHSYRVEIDPPSAK